MDRRGDDDGEKEGGGGRKLHDIRFGTFTTQLLIVVIFFQISAAAVGGAVVVYCSWMIIQYDMIWCSCGECSVPVVPGI